MGAAQAQPDRNPDLDRGLRGCRDLGQKELHGRRREEVEVKMHGGQVNRVNVDPSRSE